MTLHQLAADPTDVRGTYSKGSLVCKANSNTLACTWVEPPQGAGLARFTRAADGALAGTRGFASSDHDGGTWSGELVEVGKLQ